MKRYLLAGVIALLLAPLTLAPGQPRAAATHQLKLNGHTFTLPRELTIELVAGPPLVDRPISADFDEQGRLYVSESSGFSGRAPEQLAKKPHRILRLEDTDGDGKFDKRTIFADKMMFPEGTMWYDGSLYVAAPPVIWKLSDKDGDGVADERVVWFDGKTLTGCANDLHGPYLGPDGWIYWCKGAFAPQTYERPGKEPFKTRASHIFRARPDGSGIEPVMTGGMDNPVDVVFTPGGERIFTTTFFQSPAAGKRDGLIHAVYGGIYGKEYDPIYEHRWTGPSVLPVLTHLGPAAPCGLHRYEGLSLGAAYKDNIFACLFNMRKITRHVLLADGAGYVTMDEDFLVSDNLDFHPTDVIEDADGSLLVVDTGGWYKMCCPTSQLVRPDVLGGIYRVRRKDAPRMEDPRGLKGDWSLGDPRPYVQNRAIAALAKCGIASIGHLSAALKAEIPATAQRNAVLAATRIDHPQARELVRSALKQPSELVQQTALHSISLWHDREAASQLRVLLKDALTSARSKRLAAEALGRCGDAAAVPDLLAAVGALPKEGDPMLEHSLIYALIEIGNVQATRAGLRSQQPRIQRAALIALSETGKDKLTSTEVIAALKSPDAALRDASLWCVIRHPEMGQDIASFYGRVLAGKEKLPAPQSVYLKKLAPLPAMQDLLAQALLEARTCEQRIPLLIAMVEARPKQTPPSWLDALTTVLTRDHPEEIAVAVRAVRVLPLGKERPTKLTTELLRIGQLPKLATEVRLAALAAVPSGLNEVPPTVFAFLREQVQAESPVATRTLAAEVFAKAKLTKPQLLELCDTLKSSGPLEADALLQAFASSTADDVGLRLLATLQAAPQKTSIPIGTLRLRLAKYGPRVQAEANKLYATLDATTAQQQAKLEQILGTLKTGDAQRGQRVFNSEKTSCIACHTIGYVGGKVGPDLTRIGSIRSERDLVEAVVFPSMSFVQGYQPTVVATKDGKLHNGIIRSDTSDDIVLAVAANQEVRIPRRDIEEMQPGRVSVMPAGLEQQLAPQDLADLIAFLKACR